MSIITFAVTANAQSPGPCFGLSPRSLPADFLKACRPIPPSPQQRELVFRSIPTEGAVKDLRPGQLRKLNAIRRVLALHEREEIYVVKVGMVKQASTALYARCVLVITVPDLNLLSPEELQSLAAHEIGHEYIWDEYANAKKRGDSTRLRELELICDAVAAETMRILGIPQGRLVSALEKEGQYNRERFGTARNQDEYPSMAERREFIAGTKRGK